MAKKLNAFTDADAKRIADTVLRVEGLTRELPQARETQPREVPSIFLTPGGGIAAISGSTLGSATCTRYTVTAGTLTATTETVTVYNLMSSAIGAAAYIVAIPVNGIWLAIAEDCG